LLHHLLVLAGNLAQLMQPHEFSATLGQVRAAFASLVW
jgi:hypothetical protein